jgi:hypothetical protein
VAAVLGSTLRMPETAGTEFELIAGDAPIEQALRALAG